MDVRSSGDVQTPLGSTSTSPFLGPRHDARQREGLNERSSLLRDEEEDDVPVEGHGDDGEFLGMPKGIKANMEEWNWGGWVRGMFNLENLKILIIMCFLGFALWMFASVPESEELGPKNLLAISRDYPYIHRLSRDKPLSLITVSLVFEDLPENLPGSEEDHGGTDEEDANSTVSTAVAPTTTTRWTTVVKTSNSRRPSRLVRRLTNAGLARAMQVASMVTAMNEGSSGEECSTDDPDSLCFAMYVQGCRNSEDVKCWRNETAVWEEVRRWKFDSSELFANEYQIKHRFDIEDRKGNYTHFRLFMNTSSVPPVALSAKALQQHNVVRYEVMFAGIVLVLVYVLIIFELVHRTIAALLGSFVALALLSRFGERYSLEVIVGMIDIETIGLLFGMMIMVGIFSTTGFFEYSAIKAYKLARGNLWKLATLLCIFTAVVSAFLDNVTTILLLVPVTIRICQVLDVDPVPILIGEVLFSNIGGTATPIGDPPNVIIVNDARIQSLNAVNFGSFTLHVFPGVIIIAFGCYWLLRWQVKRMLVRSPHHARQNEIRVWKETLRTMRKGISDEEAAVRAKLQQHIKQLEWEIVHSPPEVEIVAPVDISALEEKYQIKDRSLFISSCCVLGGVIIMFFIYSALPIDINLAWIAIIGAMIHLIVAGVHDIESVLEKVEFGTLLFFAGLFILMDSLEQLGLIEFIAEQISKLIGLIPEGQAQLAGALTLILWVSAIASAFIDNIPFTTAMVPVIYELAKGPLQLPIGPLTWALAFGTCLGGNGTLIGASANVVMAGLAEQDGYHISFLRFFQTGFPMMILSVLWANVYLLVFHVVILWGYPAFS